MLECVLPRHANFAENRLQALLQLGGLPEGTIDSVWLCGIVARPAPKGE